MGTEIERKFLVHPERWRAVRAQAEASSIRQGFLSSVRERVVRIRISDQRGTLTIKGTSQGISRTEFEYDIPVQDAQTLLDALCERPLIEKVRYRIEHAGLSWEVDEFEGENQGLWLAEVELADASQSVVLPPWVSEEVSDDPRYFNANLICHPFSQWKNRAD